MRRPWFVVVVACAIIPVVLAGMMAVMRFQGGRSRLPERGVVVERLAGLGAQVDVICDRRGIPYVRAESETDMWFAQGYVHARDRFFQMELARRAAAGRLAELLGEEALGIDRKMRTWRIAATAKRQVAQLAKAEQEALKAYAAGVNAAVERFGRQIAPEMWLLGMAPELWQPSDSVGVTVVLQLHLSWAMGAELARAVELAHYGRKRAVDLWGWTPHQAETWIPSVEPPAMPRRQEEAITPSMREADPESWGGSNSWAVAGARTATKRPLLANDPHVGVTMPGIWYAISLQSPQVHVAGVSIPGAPGVAIGHTEGVAWGITMLMLDDQDLFVLEMDESGAQEKVGDLWQPLRTVTEEIKVRWRDEPELIKIRMSENGPVVRDTNRTTVALCWAGFKGPSPLRAFLAMDRATSVAEVASAWEGVVGPGLNLVAADVEGHILHQAVGRVPARGRGAGRLPAPGSDRRWCWEDFLPLAANPHRVDPAEGFLVSANHDLFSEGDYPDSGRFAAEFVAPWRVRRIRAALAHRDDWDIAACLRLQSDLGSQSAAAALQMLRPDLKRLGGPTAETLLAWDARMSPTALAPHLYSRLMLELADEIGGDEAERENLDCTPFDPERVLRLLASGLDASWWDDVRTEETEDRGMIVARVLARMDSLQLDQEWGEVHRVHFAHPFLAAPVIGPVLGRAWSRGPFGVGGDDSTVNAHYWNLKKPYQVTAIPSLRFVADVGNWDATVLVLPVGQSGRPWSSHYADQIGLWLSGEGAEMPFTPAAIERAARARLVLKPAAPDRTDGRGTGAPSSPPQPREE